MKPSDIGTVVAQKEFTPSACSQCGKECAVGIQHSVKVFGVWKQWRECVDCFLEQSERAERSIATAEGAGV